MVRQSPAAPMTRVRRAAPSPAGAARRATEPDQIDDLELPATRVRTAPVHAELGPIIRSKIQPPVLRDSTLSRPRLVDRLREATSRRLTLLIAEAGYGKTTLMADFAVKTGIRTLWYRLDPTDADIVTWTNHIIASLREVEPTFGQATLDLIAHLPAGGPPPSAFVSSVIGEMGALDPVATVLVLDDFHAVDGSEEAGEFVARLMRDAPPWLSLVVSSRRRPSFEMGRLAAADEVAEIGTDELRFSIDETGDLFANGYGTPLEEGVLRQLDDKVNGWAASLQLFHGSIRGRAATEVRALARALSGATGPIYDFLAEEVLANLSPELEELLVRCSLLDRIDATRVVALFGDQADPPTIARAQEWLDEADRLMLLSRSGSAGELRQIHPLLRDFLSKLLRQRCDDTLIRQMHLRVATATEATQPLVAAHHFVEAGEDAEAMRCLGASVMLMMGSGQWGVASDLIARIRGVPMEPAVAAIQGRRLLQEGLLDEASTILDVVDVMEVPADIRAAIRNSRLSIGWRRGDTAAMEEILREIDRDEETPQVLREIAQVYVVTRSGNPNPQRLDQIARHLTKMSQSFDAIGHHFYSAVAIHNAAFTYLVAGEYKAAVDAGRSALDAFSALPFFAVEQLSTHASMALAFMELGHGSAGETHMQEALSTGQEFADVPAMLAMAVHVTGKRDLAAELLGRARLVASRGQSDLAGEVFVDAAHAVLDLESRPDRAVSRLTSPIETPLDVGLSINRAVLLAEALLAAGRAEDAFTEASHAVAAAEAHGVRPALARARIVQALSTEDETASALAFSGAARSGALALLEVAPLIVHGFEFLGQLSPDVGLSIQRYPDRWLPLLRRALVRGNTRGAHLAATVLEEHGAKEDVGLLRAFAKTYGRRGPARTLGKKLARRVSPKLLIHDLGRVELQVGDRWSGAAQMRRKPASVLMYLVTRPGMSANREQVIDELWPEGDPAGAINSLNQSLYFLRREIDEWYEDDVSVDYIHFQGDLVWLDRELVAADSVEFADAARGRIARTLPELSQLIQMYRAPFAPEFEYEEWAMSWRSRLHSTFLDLASSVIERAAREQNFTAAQAVAAHALQVDDSATDVERRLVWLYHQMGLESAARAQYTHLAAVERADGFDPVPYEVLVRGSLPGLE